MKKLLIITNLFWVAATASYFIYFKGPKGPTPPMQKPCTSFCYDYSGNAFSGVSFRAAQKMADLYRQNHLPRFQAGMQSPNNADSRSVWFSLETIKKFIYEVDRNVCENGCPQVNKNTLGIRFYFGEYPKNVASDPLFAGANISNQYSGVHTLFMVPTYWDSTIGDHVDYDPMWTNKNQKGICKPTSLSKYASENEYNPALNSYKFLGVAPQFNRSSNDPNDPNGMQNHGYLCPPSNCPGMSF